MQKYKLSYLISRYNIYDNYYRKEVKRLKHLHGCRASILYKKSVSRLVMSDSATP